MSALSLLSASTYLETDSFPNRLHVLLHVNATDTRYVDRTV